MYIVTQKIDKEKTLDEIEKCIKRALNEHISYNDKPWAYYYYGKADALKELYEKEFKQNISKDIEDLLDIFDMLVEKDGEECEQD